MKEMKRTFGRTKYSFIIVCILFGGLLFTACKKSNDNNVNVPVAALMAFNLAPDKPSVGINLSGSALTQAPLNYTGFTGNYISIYPGTRNIEAFDNSSTPFSSSQYSFDSSRYYSLFVMGNNGAYQNVVTNDNFDSLTATSGSAYLRYVNAIPDSSKPAISISAGGNSIINTSTGYATVSSFVAAPAGDVNVGISNESTINASRTITLEEKKVYTILLMGNPAATDSTGKVQIRFIQNGGL